MLIVALVLAVVGLAALVMAVVTSNELIAWVCIAASVVGVVLLIVDAIRDRSKSDVDETSSDTEVLAEGDADYEDYPDEAPIAEEYDETSRDDTVAVDVASAEQSAEPLDDEKPKN